MMEVEKQLPPAGATPNIETKPATHQVLNVTIQLTHTLSPLYSEVRKGKYKRLLRNRGSPIYNQPKQNAILYIYL